jgi:putative ABC transport system permease protein
MFRNYLVIGFRNLLKNKLFSAINISGMAISVACFLSIGLFVFDELQYDRHVKDAQLKYRVYNEMFSDDGNIRKGSMVSPMIAPTLKAEYPEVDYHFRYLNLNSSLLFAVGETKMTEGQGGYGEPTMFDMFDIRLVEGDRKSVLAEPNTIAISQTLAEKYFGDKPALGQVIKVGTANTTVAGVYEDFSTHSHFKINYLLRLDDLASELGDRMQSWQWQQFHTYIQLKPGSDAAALEGKLKEMAERHAWPVTKPNGGYYIPHLMALQDVHLKSADQLWDIADRGNATTVYILLATAIFILVIAILNFVNLSTARAVNRMKEVGVRKSVGAVRGQLIKQFMSESVIIAVIALVIGALLVQLALPLLNSFTGKNIATSILIQPVTLLIIIVFAILIGLAAGAYPAFYVSAFKPSHILGGKQATSSGKNLLRKSLVVVQFILSFIMITAAIVVTDQLNFIQNKDVGFDMDNVVVLPMRGGLNANKDATKNMFANHPNVVSTSLCYGLPGQAFAGDGFKDLQTGKDWHCSMLTVDHDYVKTLGLTIIAGRDFSREFPNDEHDAFILSEAAAKMIGYADPKDAIGHKVGWNRWDDDTKIKEGTVVGIIEDVYLNSLHQNVTPVMLQVFPFGFNTLTVRVKSDDVQSTIAHLEKTWKQLEPEWPFQYKFLDANFDQLYKSEERLSSLFSFFTGFAIFVACLGLFGLVVYNTTQRFKEISIRKVLGAKESQIVLQLGRSYILLIGIAFIIAIPFSYYAAQQWLSSFPYHTGITVSLFAKAAAGILIVSLATVGFQTLKAARTNPVNALKEQ